MWIYWAFFFFKKKQKLIFGSIKNIPIYSVDFLPLKSLFKILAQLLSSESACFGGASCWCPQSVGETDLPEKVTHRKHQTVTWVCEGQRAKGSWRNKDFLKDSIKNWADRRLEEDIYNL